MFCVPHSKKARSGKIRLNGPCSLFCRLVQPATLLTIPGKKDSKLREIYKIAGHVFAIDTIYEDTHRLCRNYRSDEEPEFTVATTQEDIDKEEAATIKEYRLENIPFEPLPAGNYEMMAVYMKAAETLLQRDIILCHGSTLAVDNCAYMFIAKSGTGKSTHSKMWRELLGSEVTMVNDDKPLVQIGDKGVTAYGTPWNGKHRLGENIAVPLKGICILRRGEKNTIRQISLSEAYPMLLQQVYRVPGRENIKKEMTLIDRMAPFVQFYDMSCNISTEAAEMAYKEMHGGERLK